MTTRTRQRWIAPASPDVHPHFALVRHADKHFSFSELVLHMPCGQTSAAYERGPGAPQEWWDDLARRSPAMAQQMIARCQPRDFEILDLCASEALGCA